MITPEERYAVKSKRIKDVVALKEPDRVPFAPKIGNYYARDYVCGAAVTPLHGGSHRLAIEGRCGAVEYHLVSADYINFQPQRICE